MPPLFRLILKRFYSQEIQTIHSQQSSIHPSIPLFSISQSTTLPYQILLWMAPIRVELNPTIRGNCRRAHCRGEKCLPEWGMWKIPGRTSSLLLSFFFLLFFLPPGGGVLEGKKGANWICLCCLKWNQFPEFFKGERGHGQHYNSGFSSVPCNVLVRVLLSWGSLLSLIGSYRVSHIHL